MKGNLEFLFIGVLLGAALNRLLNPKTEPQAKVITAVDTLNGALPKPKERVI